MMKQLQKSGGIAAIIHSVAYLVAIGLYLGFNASILEADSAEYLALLPDYQGMMYVWIFIGYWVAAAALIVVALALYDLLKAQAPAALQVATVFGLIWAALIIGSGNLMLNNFIEMVKLYALDPKQAQIVWEAVKLVENGFISGNELIGGIWSFMVSLVVFRKGGFPKGIGYLGLILGFAGIISVIPPVTEVAVMIFGIGMIFWFAWLGIALLKKSEA